MCISIYVSMYILCQLIVNKMILENGKKTRYTKASLRYNKYKLAFPFITGIDIRFKIGKYVMYRVFINYCVFSLKFCDFSDLCQFYCSAGVVPACCVYTHWHRGKTEKGKSLEYSKIFQKTQYLMNTL